MIRKDFNDLIFRTEEEKNNAIIKKIIDKFKGKYKFGISWKSFKNRYSFDKWKIK